MDSVLILELLLAAAGGVTGDLLGRRAGRGMRSPADAHRLRLLLRVTAGLVGLRVVVVALLWTAGWNLVSQRVILGLPVVVLPLSGAFIAVARNRGVSVAGHLAATGAVVSAYLVLVPPGPQDFVLAVVASLVLLLFSGVLSVVVGRWREGGSRAARAPWLVVPAAVAGALGLAVVSGVGQSGAAMAMGGHSGPGMVSVADLTGPTTGTPDVRVTLTAAHGTVRLSSGKTLPGLLFNGTAPGPTLRLRLGRLAEITLVNTDVTEGVTLHWHGVDVPNAEDGVPGVTQDAVMPGQKLVYRFIPDRAGTFWYHTHRDGRHTVEQGLFGALIVDPSSEGRAKTSPTTTFERTVFTHTWPGVDGPVSLNTADQPEKDAVAAGRAVLLRVINSSRKLQSVALGGVSFAVSAIDGNAVTAPSLLPAGTDLELPAGGRYDLAFTMPDQPVTLRPGRADGSDGPAVVLSPTGNAGPTTIKHGEVFDPIAYGSPAAAPAVPAADRRLDLILDNGLNFGSGGLNFSNTMNGRLSPHTPAFMVAEGEHVRIRVTNRSVTDHPMHLHGHRVRVLSRNGTPVTGSPWWTDTLNVAPTESYELAFTADNPGVWMDHCHNFDHSSSGMVMHLAYFGVHSPYRPDPLSE